MAVMGSKGRKEATKGIPGRQLNAGKSGAEGVSPLKYST